MRDAYRRAARAHHPDRHGEHMSTRMAEINRAWHVLGDPSRRREYDRSLAVPVSAPAPSAPAATPPPPMPLAPARIPWRFMAVMTVLGVIVVVIGLVTAGDPPPPTVDNVLQPGDCVVIEANGDAAERLCTEPHDGVVAVFLTDAGPCPAGTELHRDRQGMGEVCISGAP